MTLADTMRLRRAGSATRLITHSDKDPLNYQRAAERLVPDTVVTVVHPAYEARDTQAASTYTRFTRMPPHSLRISRLTTCTSSLRPSRR